MRVYAYRLTRIPYLDHFFVCPNFGKFWTYPQIKEQIYGVKNKNFRIAKALIFIGAMTLSTVFTLHWFSSENFRKNFFPPKKPYFEVRLLNRCLLHEKYFFVELLGKDEKFYFQNSRSKVFAEKGNKARLLIDSKYLEKFNLQNFKYIEQDMLLIAECNFDNSIQKAITSIRGTFSSD